MFLRILFSLLFIVYFTFMTIKSYQDEAEIEHLNSVIEERDKHISNDYDEKSSLKGSVSNLSTKYSECLIRNGKKEVTISRLEDKCGKKCKDIN